MSTVFFWFSPGRTAGCCRIYNLILRFKVSTIISFSGWFCLLFCREKLLPELCRTEFSVRKIPVRHSYAATITVHTKPSVAKMPACTRHLAPPRFYSNSRPISSAPQPCWLRGSPRSTARSLKRSFTSRFVMSGFCSSRSAAAPGDKRRRHGRPAFKTVPVPPQVTAHNP